MQKLAFSWIGELCLGVATVSRGKVSDVPCVFRIAAQVTAARKNAILAGKTRESAFRHFLSFGVLAALIARDTALGDLLCA